MNTVDLRRYDNSWYDPGRSLGWRVLWHVIGMPVLRNWLILSSSMRVRLLRLFGARIGGGVVIKPDVQVKYPWHLVIGNDCWIGEGCWIDNLTTVQLGNNVCISQGAYLCTGNHDWSDPDFGLMVLPIVLADGAWVGAKSILTPGSTLGEGSIASAGSVVHGAIPEYEIFTGNPAIFYRRRVVQGPTQHYEARERSEQQQSSEAA